MGGRHRSNSTRAANPTRRNTVPVGPSSPNRPFAMAAPSWTDPIENSTRPVGGTASAAPRSRPKPRMVVGLQFGGIFAPSHRLRGRQLYCQVVSARFLRGAGKFTIGHVERDRG